MPVLNGSRSPDVCPAGLVLGGLILQFAVLAEAVIDLRTAQRHATQAAAARTAAERLHAALRSYTAPLASRVMARAQVSRPCETFPVPLQQVPAKAVSEYVHSETRARKPPTARASAASATRPTR